MDPSKSSVDIAAMARQSLKQALSPDERGPSKMTLPAPDSIKGGELTSTEDLVAAYFMCEDPSERDLVYEALRDRPLAETKAFFMAMAEHDQDPILRVQAAAYLAKEKVLSAWVGLEAELNKTQDATLVEEILSAAAEADSARGFAWAEQIWENVERASRVRCASMRVMSATDAARACTLFLARLPEWLSQPEPPQDLIERALSSIAQEKTSDAAPRIQKMLNALTSQKNVLQSDSVREDLCSMLDESRLLLELA